MGEVLLICHDNDRSFVYDSRMYSPLIDSINDYLRKNQFLTISIPKPYTKYKKKDIYGNVIIYDHYFKITGILSNLIRNIFFLKKYEVSFKAYIWRKIFKNHKPLFIIAIQPWEEMCIAAKSLNIEIFDLQHGVLDDNEYYGNHFRKYKNETNNGWPTSILCWDKGSKEWIKSNCKEIKNSYVIGQPFLNRFIYKCENDDLVNKIFNTHSENQEYKKIKDLNTKKVLFTEQWLFEKKKNKCEIGIPDDIIEIINDSNIDVFWLLRIHPVTIQQYGTKAVYKELKRLFYKNQNIDWKIATESPLPLILDITDIHVTKNSSTIKEASYLGIKSAILDNDNEKNIEWFKSEIEDGYAVVVSSKNELTDFIIKKSKTIKEHGDNIKKDINKILNKYRKIV